LGVDFNGNDGVTLAFAIVGSLGRVLDLSWFVRGDLDRANGALFDRAVALVFTV